MHLFQASVHSVFATMCIVSFFHFLFLVNAIQQREHQQKQKRIKRSLFTFFSDSNDNKQYHTGNNSPMIQSGVDGTTIPPKDLSAILEKNADRLIQGATDVVLTPVTWLAHLQKYW